jgi:hypothetical protein
MRFVEHNNDYRAGKTTKPKTMKEMLEQERALDDLDRGDKASQFIPIQKQKTSTSPPKEQSDLLDSSGKSMTIDELLDSQEDVSNNTGGLTPGVKTDHTSPNLSQEPAISMQPSSTLGSLNQVNLSQRKIMGPASAINHMIGEKKEDAILVEKTRYGATREDEIEYKPNFVGVAQQAQKPENLLEQNAMHEEEFEYDADSLDSDEYGDENGNNTLGTQLMNNESIGPSADNTYENADYAVDDPQMMSAAELAEFA